MDGAARAVLPLNSKVKPLAPSFPAPPLKAQPLLQNGVPLLPRVAPLSALPLPEPALAVADSAPASSWAAALMAQLAAPASAPQAAATIWPWQPQLQPQQQQPPPAAPAEAWGAIFALAAGGVALVRCILQIQAWQ